MKIPISKIIPNPKNPRVTKNEKFKKLKKSIQEFPEMLSIRPIVVNDDYMVLGGNMRLRVCQELGFKEIEIIKASQLTPDQQNEFVIKDNLNYGEWDWARLDSEWDLDVLDDWGMDFFQKSKKFIEEDDYEIDANQLTDIKHGDLIEMGRHRLLCGDSADPLNMKKLMNGHRATCVFTDPPYAVHGGIGRKKRRFQKYLKGEKNRKIDEDILNDNITSEQLEKLLKNVFKNVIDTVISDDCSIFITSPFEYFNIYREIGMPIKHVLVWDKIKHTLSMSVNNYQYQHELIFLTWLKKHKMPMLGEHKTSVWSIKRQEKSDSHPTMKPVELYTNAYLNHTDPNDVVFDAFAGSGTAFIAAEQTNRICYALEIQPYYCQVILNRFKNFAPNTEVKINGKKYKKT